MKGEGLFVEKTFEPFENLNLKYPTQTGGKKFYIFFLLDRLGPMVGKVEEKGVGFS